MPPASVLTRVCFRSLPLLAAVFAAALSVPVQAAAPTAKILETRVISDEPQYYFGWATVATRRNGDLVLTYSGGRDGHVCPFGRVDMMVSHDEGRNWSWPRTILDTDIDDRDSGVLETAKGTLIATTFTANSYEKYLDEAEKGKSAEFGVGGGQMVKAIPAGRLAAWKAARDRLSPEERKAQTGAWIIRSTDNGASWSPQIRVPVNSPHGPILLKSGRLLYLGKKMSAPDLAGVCESTDDGLTWKWIADIPVRKGDTYDDYHELHAVEAANGTIIGQIRNHSQTNTRETLQTESTDGGKTWTTPHPIGVWGLPSHLLKLKDGRLVMSYGHRRKPFGNEARISSDNGKTWSEPIMLSPDSTNSDLGYPSTVELKDGSLLTVWYEKMPGMAKTALRQAHWTLAP